MLLSISKGVFPADFFKRAGTGYNCPVYKILYDFRDILELSRTKNFLGVFVR